MSLPEHIFLHVCAEGEDPTTFALSVAREYVQVHQDAWIVTVEKPMKPEDLTFFESDPGHFTGLKSTSYAVSDSGGTLRMLVLTSPEDFVKTKDFSS